MKRPALSLATRARPVATSFIAALVALATASCDEGIVVPTDESPIIIAGTVSETGSRQVEGMNMARGFRLAAEMLNESGGIDGRPVRLALYDDGSDPQEAAAIYRELVAADSVDLLIGPYSSAVTETVVPVAEKAGMPLVTPLAASVEIWAGHSREWSVQVTNNARLNLAGAVEVAARHGAETVALVHERSRFPISAADGARDAVAREGMTLVMDESYPIGGADHAALAARARDRGADLFIGGGYTPDAVAFTAAVAEARYTPMLTSWSVGPGEPDFPERVGHDLARCVIGNAPWVTSLSTAGALASSATFQQRYEAAYGQPPGYTAAAGFGSIELLYEAILASVAATGEIDNAAVRDHLFGTSTETVLGSFGVAPLGDPDAGSQQRLARLQLQWQDDGMGGLVQRVIYPDAAAEADACVNPPADLVVAATMSLTGPLSVDGRAAADGYRLAVEMVNEQGGIDGRPVRLLLRDDESSAGKAAGLYGEFVSGDSVDAIVGPYSSTVTHAVVPVAEAARWPLVAGLAAAPEIWEGRGRRWAAQVTPIAQNFLAGSVEVAAGADLPTFALVHHDSRFPVAVAEGVRASVAEHGLELVLDRSFSDDADYEGLAAAARDADAAVFIGGGYSDHAVALTKAADAVGYAPALMSWVLGPNEPRFLEEVGELARCVAGFTSWVPTLATAGAITDNATFVARHEAAYGTVPGFNAAAAFGSMELLVEALRASFAQHRRIDNITVRDHLFTAETETIVGPYSVVPLGEWRAGLQRAATGLQIQWQDDGMSGLAPRVIHPQSAAEAMPCFNMP